MEFKYFPGWSYQAGDHSITMTAPSRAEALKYLFELERNPCSCIRWREPITLFLGHLESSHKYRVPLTDSVEMPKEPELTDDEMLIKTQVNPITLTPDADHQRLMEWMLEQYSDGKSVCVTSQIDDKCLFQNDKLTKQRASISAREFIGQNYLWYWRNTMDDYRQLRQYLNDLQGDRDYLAGFEYRLTRPDGALCRYSTDYYRTTFLGEPVRIGVSDPAEYEIIQLPA